MVATPLIAADMVSTFMDVTLMVIMNGHYTYGRDIQGHTPMVATLMAAILIASTSVIIGQPWPLYPPPLHPSSVHTHHHYTHGLHASTRIISGRSGHAAGSLTQFSPPRC